MTILAFIIFIPLQLAWLPLSILGAVMVAYAQLRVSQKLGVSQTAIEVLNGRWGADVFAMRADPAAVKLARALPNDSVLGLWLTLFPLYVLHKISGRNLIYPRVPQPGHETVADLITARSAYFDALINKHTQGTRQFVVLGGGFDTRAYGPLQNHFTFFELDQNPTQSLKRQSLAKAGIDAGHVTFVEVDFATENWADALVKAGFDRTRPTIFLWEGVTLYLSRKDVCESLGMIKHLAAPGSVLLADLYAARFVAKMDSNVLSLALDMTDEHLNFSLDFAHPPEATLRRFIEDQGLTLGEAHFMGTHTKPGPLCAVAEIIL